MHCIEGSQWITLTSELKDPIVGFVQKINVDEDFNLALDLRTLK